ncbi:MAG: tRNA pseudouridine(55) synthase TruB [Patescibacteria group bacterium]|jgi:tRNA pseudouridine55 synthase
MLLIDKPEGLSSFAVVAQVRRALGVKRIGHAGTLDPLATGLLIVLVGRDETKQQDSFMKLDKEYVVTIELGKFSTTDDREGELTMTNLPLPTKVEFATTLKKFIGSIQQTPPIYSAIHVNGARAYKLARSGQTDMVIPTRTVIIHDIELLDFKLPHVTLRVACGHGTYIRSLAHDLGGYVTALRRTKIGQYNVAQAISVEQIAIDRNQSLIPE